ncbi:MAG: D-alanyl-D-alanine carboxypeptidase/D-alanyl-D-alanine-endopeptidase [Herbiconiux sp.]|uniref:D-alanyl-D-alanine carboxypeptidase/D-alanyl-D-alanine endopeptidase n=1 Tax=Herbiconiux sp. TaxID=1871186 RepID=UPI0011FD2454|nr:D-alanyl-D-alanine carboxypeptidase/D-alanyl-D-alanine-endopeptidase [Herbiconiux sp.]TAJ50199.1 MAG: D-alanyl-D-alanine carboxypeptidase/D-alanyl-D-alanine-endopeptidase [Herbiconiux sp.]
MSDAQVPQTRRERREAEQRAEAAAAASDVASGAPAASAAPTLSATESDAVANAEAEAKAEAAAEAQAEAEAEAGARGGIRSIVRRHPRAWAAAAAAVALVVLGGGAFAAGAAMGATAAPAASALVTATPTETPTPTPTPTVDARTQPQLAAAPAPVRTCSVADLATDGRLGTFLGSVRNAATGEVLFDRNATTPARTASVMKVLSSAAALAVLGPDYRVPTTVVAGSTPGQVVLVGGGDITLASGSSNIYTDSASMQDLASQVNAAWSADPSRAGTPITSIVLDASIFSGDRWQPSWLRKEQVDGYSSEVTGLQVDGDRADPSANVSTRSDNAVLSAGQAFADALGVPNASLAEGVAAAGSTQLGQVLSAPVSTMIPDALLRSDNTEAEMLARLVAVKLGVGSDFAALNTAIPQALATYGINTSGLTIVDGSGLSDDNGVPPNFLSELFIHINNREGNLGIIADGLPVAGESGTLAGRFGGSPAAGNVVAKTGWIDTGYTLSGIIRAADGSVLTFAFFALDDVGDSAKTAIDALTTGVYECGNGLSNN